MSESARTPRNDDAGRAPMHLASTIVELLAAEERYWQQAGNKARAQRFAVVRRIVGEEAARGGRRPSPLLRALGEFYRPSA